VPKSKDQLESGSRPYTWRIVAAGIVVALYVLAPIAVVAGALIVMSQRDVVTDKNVWIAPEKADDVRNRAIALELSWSEPRRVFAPAWQGIVQTVGVRAGDSLQSGQVLATIGGIDRMAFASAIPFSRPLGVGDAGADVRGLNEMLAALGYAAGDDNAFTSSTLRGVRSLAERLAVPNWSETSAFDPGWIVFLPADALIVAETSLIVGAVAPAGGEVIATSSPQLSSAGLVAIEDLSTADLALTTSADNKPPSVATTPIVADESEELRLSTSVLALSDDRSHVAEASLSELTRLLANGSMFTRAVLSMPIEAGSIRVPSGAVITSSDGALCIAVASSIGADGVAGDLRHVAAEVIASERGSSWVVVDVKPDERVLVNPHGRDRSCQP